MYNDFMKMLDDVLLADMSGFRRALWRRRIIAYQAFKACLTARGAGDKATERVYEEVGHGMAVSVLGPGKVSFLRRNAAQRP